MSTCLSNEEIVDALLDVVILDMLELAKPETENKTLDLNDYVNKIYNFVLKSSENQQVAETAAALTPGIMDKILANSDELEEAITTPVENENLRADILKLKKRYKDILEVRKDLGLDRVPDTGFSSSKNTMETGELPKAKDPVTFEDLTALDLMQFGTFVSYGPEVINWWDPTSPDYLKPRPEQERNYNALRYIADLLRQQIGEKGIANSGEMIIPGIGPVFLSVQHAANVDPKIKNQFSSQFRFRENELVGILVDASGTPVTFSDKGSPDKEGKAVAFNMFSPAPMLNGKLIFDENSEDFQKFVEKNNLTKDQVTKYRAITKNLRLKAEALTEGKVKNIDSPTAKDKAAAKKEAQDQLNNDYQSYFKMAKYLFANKGSQVKSVVTAVAKGFVQHNEYKPTNLSDIDFSEGFSPIVITKEQGEGSVYTQGVTYFKYPGVDDPIAINNPALKDRPEILNSIISLFTDELYEVVDGVTIELSVADRQKLIDQFILKNYTGIAFESREIDGQTVYLNTNKNDYTITINGEPYYIKYDGSDKAKQQQKEASDAIRKFLTTASPIANEKGLPKDNKAFNTLKSAQQVASQYGATIVEDLEQADASSLYVKRREGGYDIYRVQMPTILIQDKLIEGTYSKPVITRDAQGRMILTREQESYNEFLKNNFVTSAVAAEDKKIKQINPVLSFAPTVQDSLKFMASESKQEQKAPKGVSEDFKGKVVFMSPGSGKTTLANKDANVIDADDLTIEALRQVAPEFPIDNTLTAAKNIYDAIVYGGVNKELLYDQVKKMIKNATKSGKTVVTGSRNLLDIADFIFIQRNAEINKAKADKGYDQKKEIAEIGDREYTNVSGYASNVLSKSFDALKSGETTVTKEAAKPEEKKAEEPKTDAPVTQKSTADMKSSDIIAAMRNIKINKSGRLKAANKGVSEEDLKRALEWFKNSPVGKIFPFEVETMFNAVNATDGPAASWSIHGTILYHYFTEDGKFDPKRSGDFTDLYHEAWHGFTQTFLTQKQRDEMYAEMRKRKGSFTDYMGNLTTYANADAYQLEEQMAEEFREYSINAGKPSSIKQAGPAQKSIFRKILDFLKALFKGSKTEDVIKDPLSHDPIARIYNELHTGAISKYNFDINNRDTTIGKLDKAFVAKNPKEGQPKILGYKDSALLVETVDSLIVQVSKELNGSGPNQVYHYTSQIMGNPELRKYAYAYVKDQMANVLIPQLEQQRNATENSYEKDQIQQRINLLNYAIDNFGDVDNFANNKTGEDLIGYHIIKSAYLAEEDKKDAFDVADEELDEAKQMVNNKNDAYDRSGNEKSVYELAAPEVKYLLRSIFKYDAGNKVEMNSLGAPKLTDAGVVWNKLARILGGAMERPMMYEALQRAAYDKVYDKNGNLVSQSVKDPIIAEIIERLGPVDRANGSLAENMLWQKFWSTFYKAYIPLVQVTVKTIKTKQGDVEVTSYDMTIGSANSGSRRVVNLWSNGFKSMTSKYIINNQDINDADHLNQNYLDVDKIIADFGTGPNKLLKEDEYYNFFNALGLKLSDRKIIKDAINSKENPLGNAPTIFKRLKQISQEHGIKKIYSLEDVFGFYAAKKGVDEIQSDYSNLNAIAEFETKNGDYSANYMVTNAEGNTQYEQSLHNSMSIMISSINDVKDFRDSSGKIIKSAYKVLMDKPHMRHLDITRNPFAANSIWLNSIFNLRDAKGNLLSEDDPTFGTKRTLKDGKEARLNISNLSGVQMVDEAGSDGISSASADEFTKLIMDFHLSIMSGKPELMRHADKGTSFSVWLDQIIGGADNKKSYADYITFFEQATSDPSVTKIAGYSKVYTTMNNYLSAEMERITKLKEMQRKIESGDTTIKYDANYLKEGQNFSIFEGILSENTKNTLLKYNSLADAKAANPEIANTINKEIKDYFEDQTKEVGDLMSKANFIVPTLSEKVRVEATKLGIGKITQEGVRKALTRAFVINSWIHNIESMAVIYGDIAQYNMKKEEFHKRNAGAGSTGNLMATDEYMIDFVNNKGRGWAKKEGYKEKKLASDASIETAILADNEIPSKYFGQLAEAMIAKEMEGNRLSKEEAERKVLGYDEKTKKKGTIEEPLKSGSVFPYYNMTEGDAQGWITFDFYRIASMMEGQWTNKQENMYQDIIANKPIAPELITQFFPVKKYQYWGPIKTDNPNDLPVMGFHKFSLLPLVPSLIEGTNLKELHNKMMNKGIDYAVFKSGSKISTITRIDKSGKAIQDQFYKKDTDREFNAEDDLTPNTIYLQFLKNQLDIAPKYKGSVTFPTQMRKLIENALYELGLPKKPEYEGIVKRYEDDIRALTEKKKEILEKEAGVVRVNGKIKFNKQLQEFLIRELSRQDLADHEIDYIRVANGGESLAHDLSLSLSSEKLEKILTSIAVNRLIKQKFNGEALIQVSGAGFEKNISLRGQLTEKEKEEYGTNGLDFYRPGEKGKPTRAMKVKIALQGDFMKLLGLKHKDNKTIGSIDRLNEMLKDEEWLDKDNHRQMVTISGPRIPTQENNSMEFAEVYQFLDPKAGNIVILPSEIVAKSGGDFDIDKITFMFPNIKSKINWDGAETKEAMKSLATEFPELGLKGIQEAVAKKKAKKELSDDERLVLDKLAQLGEKTVTIPMDTNTEEGLENRIIKDMTDILSLPEMYVNLIRPNGTDLVKPIADELAPYVNDTEYRTVEYKDKGETQKRIPGTRVFEIGYNLYKHRSNNIGKQTLGLGAVDNTYNTVFNRIGAYMNDRYTTRTGVSRRISLLLDHNKTSQIMDFDKEGYPIYKDVISLSNLYDATGKTSISSVIAQLINGWVDIAKDAWIFNLQGNKEVAPNLLFMVQAGVPIKQAVYFVSHPLIRKYVEEQKLAKSTFATPLEKGSGNPMFYKNDARSAIFKMLRNSKRTEFDDFQNRDKFLDERTRELTGKSNIFEKGKTEERLLDRIKAYSEAQKNNETFEFNEDDEAVFLHYLEVEEMAKAIRDIKLNTNVDTSTTGSIFEIDQKLNSLEMLEANKFFPRSIVTKIKESSPIGSFFLQEFMLDFLRDLFPLKANEMINDYVQAKMKDFKSFKADVDKTFGDSEAFINNWRNDLPSFIFQNSLRKINVTDQKEYRGVLLNKDYTVEELANLKFGAFVKIDEKTGEPVIYVDKAKLLKDYSFLDTLEYKVSLKEGVEITMPPLKKAIFPTPQSYYLFVFERELLRNRYKGMEGWLKLQEQKPVKDRLKSYLNSTPKLENETDKQYSARINTMAYEDTIKDMALDNSFNEYKMFRSKHSMADQLTQIQLDYPELLQNYTLVQNLSPNIYQDHNGRSANIMLNDTNLDGDKLNVYHENLRELSDEGKINIDASAEEKKRVAAFFANFGVYAFLQSSMNTKGQFSLTRLVPQEKFTRLMTTYVPEFVSNLNHLTLEKYWDKFVKTNSSKNKRMRSRQRDYTIPAFNPAADKATMAKLEKGNIYKETTDPVKARIDVAKKVLNNTLAKTEEEKKEAEGPKVVITEDQSGNKVFNAANVGPKTAAVALSENPQSKFVINGVAADVGGNYKTGAANKHDAALFGAKDTYGNVVNFPSRKSFTTDREGNPMKDAQLTDVQEDGKEVKIVSQAPVSKVVTKEQAIAEYGDKLMGGVSLRSKQEKIKQGDEKTILEAYNFLKAEEKFTQAKAENEKRQEKLKDLKQRIDTVNQTKVGDVLKIYNDANASEYKGKVKAIEFRPNGAYITITTAKNKEYSFSVDESGFTKDGNTHIENFVFRSTGEDRSQLVKEYNALLDIYKTEDKKDISDYWIDYSQPQAPVSKGIEISSNAKGLAAALTNPTELAKSKGNLTQSYPVNFRGKTYKDAEAAYQALKSTATKDEGPNSTYNLMVDIIKAKLEQYPRLVEEITKQGGSAWILSSTHQPTKQNTVWETGGKNWFIKSLNDAYLSFAPTARILEESPVTSLDAGVKTDMNDDSKTIQPINGRTISSNVRKQIDQTIQAMRADMAAGYELVFPKGGLGQYMIGADQNTGNLPGGKITPIAPATFVYLSTRLWKEFGYINPNFDKVLAEYGMPNVLQENAVVTDQDVEDALSFCFIS